MKSILFLISLTILIGQGVVGEQDTCNETCEEECTCPARRTCTETEIDCGPSSETPTGHCDSDRICVASNCQCPSKATTGEECPLVCNVECGEAELLCSGPNDGRGCKTPDLCVAKGMGTDGHSCPGICPVSCQEDEIQCPKASDENGCTQAPECVAKGKDRNGLDCAGVCPLICEKDQLLCGGKVSDNGCQEVDICVQKGKNSNDDVCSGSCPVECQNSEIHCVGPILPDGCKMADVCHPKAKNIEGENCPLNSASHDCAVSCSADETLCPGHANALGCKAPDACKAKTKDESGEFCPATSVCHTPCKMNEISCAGGMDVNGCKKPDECHPMGRDNQGNLCETHCPGECNEDEVFCPGQLNSDDCKGADICTPRGTKSCGPDVGGECNGFCPVECSANEIKCSTQLDPCDCCPTEEVCRPAAKNIHGVFCDANSASHNCPMICDEQNGEVLCPGYEDELGCKGNSVCIKRAADSEGNVCPAHSVCPIQCGGSEMLCPDGLDHTGCKNADRCLARGSNVDGNLCPIQCPPVCNDETQVLCTGEIQENGCTGGDVCVAKLIGNDGAQCKTICPITCEATEIKVPGGEDENGCPKEDTCGVPKTFGPWKNDGACQGTGENPTCGPGIQVQKRTCTDGIIEKCTESSDTERRAMCSVVGTNLPACPPACGNGDVKLEDDGTPLVLWNDVWSPICGHYFWDDQVGANKFCEKLGYEQGEQSGNDAGNHYTTDGFKIGKCVAADDWSSGCTGGCNDYELGGTCSNSWSISPSSCAKEDAMAITISCSQPSNLVFNPSCTAYKQLGDWTNDGNCETTGNSKACGPGIQKQTRSCTDGVNNKCSEADTDRTTSCTDAGTALPDCVVEKQLGGWTNEDGCVATGEDKTCGPGTQRQSRTCTDGTMDKCTEIETQQVVSCSEARTALPVCVVEKQLLEWTNEGACEATGVDKTCGPGTQRQTRACIDGTTDLCTDADTSQTVSCDDAGSGLPDCVVEKQLGEYANKGACEATGIDKTCGPGTQRQTRYCTDGTTDLCTDADTSQTVSCGDAGSGLPDCVVEKQLGEYTNEGACEATGVDKTCGPGTQRQTRACTDGTTDLCTDADTSQTVSCGNAGSGLPDCVVEKQLGEWTNEGACEATGEDKTCGPGSQKQVRTCIAGTTDVCADADTVQNAPCSEAGTALPDCAAN